MSKCSECKYAVLIAFPHAIDKDNIDYAKEILDRIERVRFCSYLHLNVGINECCSGFENGTRDVESAIKKYREMIEKYEKGKENGSFN